MILFVQLVKGQDQFLMTNTRGEGLPENVVGVHGPLPKTLILFMTKIFDFPLTTYMT